MESFKNSAGRVVVSEMIKVIQDNKDYLSEIDGAIGDGDHGINMNKGFTLCAKRLEVNDSFDSSLEKLGNVLLSEIGGSMGPLYGMFFLAMRNIAKDKVEINMTIFGEMLQSAQQEVVELGSAKVGDKTLMDTLIPATTAFHKSIEASETFAVALEKMDVAAENGYKSTKDLVAKIGRASRLGERSRGFLDAGATSCYLLLNSMKKSITTLLEGE